MFLIVAGRLRIQLPDDEEVILTPGQFYVAPRGVQHNPIADEEVHIVLIETVTTAHTGTVVVDGTAPVADQVGDFQRPVDVVIGGLAYRKATASRHWASPRHSCRTVPAGRCPGGDPPPEHQRHHCLAGVGP